MSSDDQCQTAVRRCAEEFRSLDNRFQLDAAERAVAGLTGVRGIIHDIEIFGDFEVVDVTDLVADALFRYGLLRMTATSG